jgi:hypothetical protein
MLQRLVGNRATAAVLRAPDGGTATETAAPGATTTTEGAPPQPDVAPLAERGTEAGHPPPARPTFDLAGGEQILTGAFGSIKKIVPGRIEVLEQADFQAAYDKIYGKTDWSWEKYVKPTYGGLNGFAHDGTNYINKASAGLHTIVHEMLHNNCAADFVNVVGSRWNEGTTEVLTKVACAAVNEPAPTTYPGESPVVQVAIDSGLPLSDLEDAYLVGGAKRLIADWADANCVLSWAKIKALMEAHDWAAAKAGLAPKASTAKAEGAAEGAGAGSESGAGSGSESG